MHYSGNRFFVPAMAAALTLQFWMPKPSHAQYAGWTTGIAPANAQSTAGAQNFVDGINAPSSGFASASLTVDDGSAAGSLCGLAQPIDPVASFMAELQTTMSVGLGLYGIPYAASQIDWSAMYDFGGQGQAVQVTQIAGAPTNDPSMKFSDWSHVFNVAKLGWFDVPLRSDPAERTNILISASAVDGTTLMPGQVFSFNDIVGERSPGRGYQDGWMFDKGKLIRGTGGGICLVATGLYNVALRAGLDLIERHPHSGIVRYADPGCDAAVVYGSEDLRFRNSTDGPLFIRALPSASKVSMVFFGAPQPAGYQVVLKQIHYAELPPPATVSVADESLAPGKTAVDQQARPGYEVTLQREILWKGKVLRSEVVASDLHLPVGKVERYGPTDAQQIDTFLSSLAANT